MILHRTNGTQAFVSVTGATMGQSVNAVTLTGADLEALLALPPEALHNWLGTSVLTRFTPYDFEKDLEEQRQATQRHNRRLKGSEVIDDFHPAQFSADPPRNMFIGPGMVPYTAEGMTRLDPESSQVLADNLWDLYQRSDE